ncbi:MAG: glycosyltransferase [Chloroflexi bacterium]|nr:glycosyltransferase [Chloroflexota bacterium]
MSEADRPLGLAFIANPGHVLVQRWVRWFAQRGHEVTVLEGFGSGAGSDPGAGVDVVRYDARGSSRLPFASALHARRSLRRLLAEIAPDVVHAHTVRPYGWQAGLVGRHPYVVSTWGSDVLMPLPGLRARFWQRRTLSRADLVTAVSPYMRDAAIRHGARPERVVQIQFGVDTARYAPADASPPALRALDLADTPFVFSPRAMKPIYDHPTLLDAFAEATEGERLVMTGRNADAIHRADLERRMESLGIRDRVSILEDASDDEMLALYQSARVVISAPLSDSFPLTLLEAMACGTPVVAGDLPPVAAVLGPISPRSLVPTGDARAIARALRDALAMDERERERLGAELRRIVVETADHATNMELMESRYRDLARRRS